MKYQQQDILEFVEENDVKFIRLAFCDMLGNQKNIAIMPEELERAFGQGIAFDESFIPGFSDITTDDLFLVPDASTITVLPWRPSQGSVARFFCDIKTGDGTAFEGDARALLKQTVDKYHQKQYSPRVGTECEFYLFLPDQQGLPTLTPYDTASYFDIAPADKGENVRREICLLLEQMGIAPESSHHERGPGQNEIVLKHQDVLAAADHFLTLKTIVKTVADQNGLFASFMPKPLTAESGSGSHVSLSLFQGGKNIFYTDKPGNPSFGYHFSAGILKYLPELTVFTNPTTNSYARLNALFPHGQNLWSGEKNRRLGKFSHSSETTSRIEIRTPDPSMNPYLALTLFLEAGLRGVAEGCILPENPKEPLLPRSLGEAIKLAQQSELVQGCLPPAMLNQYLRAKSRESEGLGQAPDRHEHEIYHYFTNL